VTHLLDTDVCIAWLEGRDGRVRERMLEMNPAALAVSAAR